jgi:hypothetical protein
MCNKLIGVQLIKEEGMVLKAGLLAKNCETVPATFAKVLARLAKGASISEKCAPC